MNALPNHNWISNVLFIIIRYGIIFLILGIIGFNSMFIFFGGEIVIIEGTFLGEHYISSPNIFTQLVLYFILFSEIIVFCFLFLGHFSMFLLDPSIFIGAIWASRR